MFLLLNQRTQVRDYGELFKLNDIDCDFDSESDRHRQAFWPGDTLRTKE